MSCITIGQFHVKLGGPDLGINVGGEDVLFENHPYCGPMPVGKRGNPKHLAARHPFWRAVTIWATQGYQIFEGRAIYAPPPTTRLVKVDKRNAIQEDEAKRLGITGEIIEVPDY